MNATLEKLSQFGIVPVVVLDDAKDAAPLAQALCDGGLACAEVTFRTAAAEESIRIMATEHPEMVVGAGTVLTTEQVDRAVNAGAKFIVSPGLNPKVVKYCLEKGIPVTPGVVTPSEMEQAIELGLEAVKFFPAEPSGGLNMIKAVAAPYFINGDYQICVDEEHMTHVLNYYGFTHLITTLRKSISASDNGWSGAVCTADGLYHGRNYDLHIVDRVGGGDSFASGCLHGILAQMGAEKALEFGLAAAAIKHTIPGDLNFISETEVLNLMDSDGAGRVQR